MDKLIFKDDDKPLTDDEVNTKIEQHLRDLEAYDKSLRSWPRKLKFHIDQSLNWIFKFVLGLFGFLICLFGLIFLYFFIFG